MDHKRPIYGVIHMYTADNPTSVEGPLPEILHCLPELCPKASGYHVVTLYSDGTIANESNLRLLPSPSAMQYIQELLK